MDKEQAIRVLMEYRDSLVGDSAELREKANKYFSETILRSFLDKGSPLRPLRMAMLGLLR